MARRILDIRIYENHGVGQMTAEQRNIFGQIKHDSTAERFALKLSSLELETGDWDHLYISLTKQIPAGDINLRGIGDQVLSVVAGVEDKDLYEIDWNKRLDFRLKIISDCFYLLAKSQPLDLSKVEKARKLLKEHGQQLEIIQKEKMSKGIHVIVSHTVNPKSHIYLYVMDSKSGRQGKRQIADLHRAGDARTLVSRIAVKDGEVLIYPRNSASAQFTRNQYFKELYFNDEFIRVSIEDLLTNHPWDGESRW